jgi:transposase InsO family protein
MSLKERLTSILKGTSSVYTYLQTIRSIADELTLIGNLVDDIDLVIHTLNGLGPSFKEFTASIRTRDNPILFNDLYDKLVAFEMFLQHEENLTTTPPMTANYVHSRQNNYGQGRNFTRSPSNSAVPKNKKATSSYEQVTHQFCEKDAYTSSFAHSSPSLQLWHHRLGHLAHPTLLHALKSSNISFSGSFNKCSCCLLSKSHKLPFSKSSLVSSQPLQIVYSDVWGLAPFISVDGFCYYVIFIDHFSKYVWLYPLKLKSDVSRIFKNLVENQFNCKIKTFYSDNGGEFVKLRFFFQQHGISHLTTPPHTPEHNGLSERKHRHMIETARCLLNHASLPLTFWTFALQTTAYLINRLPTPGLNMRSPHIVLFKCSLN